MARNLQGHHAPLGEVVCAVDRSHSAATEHLQQPKPIVLQRFRHGPNTKALATRGATSSGPSGFRPGDRSLWIGNDQG